MMSTSKSNDADFNFVPKHRILVVGFDDYDDLQSEIREKNLIEEVVTLNSVFENNNKITADGFIKYKNLCKHVIVEYEKDELFMPKYYKILLNNDC